MREIKFRAKTKEHSKWVYGRYFKRYSPTENFTMFSEFGEERHCIESDGVVFEIDLDTLCEFTGSVDIDKNEIYENDIAAFVQDGKEKGLSKIVWFASSFNVVGINGHLANWYLEEYSNSYRVIGNTIDNSELIL